MYARTKQILLGIFLISLMVSGAQALEIGDGIYFEVDGVNYTFSKDTTLTDLDLSSEFGSTDRSLKCVPNTGGLTVEIHDYTDTLINTTQKPTVNQQVTNYFKDIQASTNFYAYKNDTYVNVFLTNTTGGSSLYGSYRSTDELWLFSTAAPAAATTTTAAATTTIYTLPPVSTTLLEYNGSYTIPDNYYLKGIYDGIQQFIIQNTETEGMCQILVDNETWFGSPEINRLTTITEYTNDEFLNLGEYNWRVRCYYRGQ